MSGSFETLSHTADTGIEAISDTFEGLLEWLAIGMFSLMFDLDPATADRTLDIDVISASRDELVVDLLAHLLYLSEAHDVVPCEFTVTDASPTHVSMDALTKPVMSAHLHGPPIKAVTYHDLSVELGDDGMWRARVVFDV